MTMRYKSAIDNTAMLHITNKKTLSAIVNGKVQQKTGSGIVSVCTTEFFCLLHFPFNQIQRARINGCRCFGNSYHQNKKQQ